MMRDGVTMLYFKEVSIVFGFSRSVSGKELEAQGFTCMGRCTFAS